MITQEHIDQFYEGYRPKLKGMPITHTELHRIAEKIRPKKYLEIGSRAGHSASYIAIASPDTKLFSVDLPGGGSGGFSGSQKYLEYHMEMFAKNRWSKTYGDSKGAKAKAFIKDNGPYDMIFIDGDHSYEGARQDYLNIKDHMKDRSILLIDDITHPAHTKDLMRLFDEVSKDYEFTKKHTKNMGVGIILKGYSKAEAEEIINER